MPPVVIDLMQGWRNDLLRGDAAMQQEMAQRWLHVEQALQAQVDALALELEGGGRVTMGQLGRSRRYQQLMGQVDDELGAYARFVEGRVVDRQRALLNAAISHGQAAVGAVASDAELLVQFNRLPVAAVEYMVGLTGAGTPVGDILADASQVGAEALRQRLVDGIALGWNPLRTARDALRNGLAQSFTRMATIARTETLRVYRQTTMESYRQSNVVVGYRRLCAKDERTCLGCLMADGQQYTLDQPFDEHPNGRCALVPVLRNTPPVQFETGQEWFERQPESVQRNMLGPSRFDLWQRGDISLGDLVTRRWDDTWGGSLVPAPVRSLAGGAGALQRTGQAAATARATSPKRSPHYRQLQDTRIEEVRAMSAEELRQLRAEIARAGKLPRLNEHFTKHGDDFADLGIRTPEQLGDLYAAHVQRTDNVRTFSYVSTQKGTQYRHWAIVGMDNGVVALYNETKQTPWSIMRPDDLDGYMNGGHGWWLEVNNWQSRPKVTRW